MSVIERQARIVAICGLDGSGKTTLWNGLRASGEIPRGVFVTRNDRRDWKNVFEGQHEEGCSTACFSVLMRWAHAFDMLQYYRSVVEPLLTDDIIIVSDRWAICSRAFAFGCEPHDKLIGQLLASVPDPDVVLVPEITPLEAHERISGRGTVQIDETVQELELLKRGYEAILPKNLTYSLSGHSPNEILKNALDAILAQPWAST